MKSTVVLITSIMVALGVVALAFYAKPEPNVELPLQVVEYSDYNCSHCRDFQPTMAAVREEFEGNDDVEIKFIMNPILGPQSEQAAYAAKAADLQGKLEEYTAILYENFEARTDEDYITFAEELDLDIEEFNEDREDAFLQQEVLEQLDQNQADGITSTPTLVINGKTQTNRSLEDIIDEINKLVEIGKN